MAQEIITSKRIETDTHVIHLEPRISAAKLAEYIVSDPSRQTTIAKNAKNASKSIVPQYHRVRGTFQHAHTQMGLDATYFTNLAAEVAAASALTTWQAGDNERSSLALKNLAQLTDTIECTGAVILRGKWHSLSIHGVTVSVSPELVFSILHRGVTKIGAVILNTPQNDNSSLAKGSGRFCSGDYLTTLLYLMLADQAKDVGAPLHSRCYAIDIFRNKTYSAPASYKTLVKHMEEACKMIALRWDSIPIETDTVADLI